MKKLKTLLYGPMTGDMGKDRKAFNLFNIRLRVNNIDVINPLDMIQFTQKKSEAKSGDDIVISDQGWDWFIHIKLITDILIYCDALLLMPHWDRCYNSATIALAAKMMGLKLLRFRKNKLEEIEGFDIISDLLGNDDPKKLTDEEYNDAIEQWGKEDVDDYPDDAGSTGDIDVIKEDPSERERIKRTGSMVDDIFKKHPPEGRGK